jgi:hypothetical protein
MATKKPKKDPKVVARYFGAECEANPGSGFFEYQEDIAIAYGKKRWGDLTPEQKREAYQAFLDGKRDEKANYRG